MVRRQQLLRLVRLLRAARARLLRLLRQLRLLPVAVVPRLLRVQLPPPSEASEELQLWRAQLVRLHLPA